MSEICEVCNEEQVLRVVKFLKAKGHSFSLRLGARCIRLMLGD